MVAHNLRSAHNVGSLLRTADGLGVGHVYLTGYTPYPYVKSDKRLPHLAKKLHNQIHKTALGAEKSLNITQNDDVQDALAELRRQKFLLCALEQAPNSKALPDFKFPDRIALIVGSEVAGIEPEILDQMDVIVEIPMIGSKESLNVVQAAAMALYHLRYVALPSAIK